MADLTDELPLQSPPTPRFAEPRHVGRPNVGDRERLMERFAGILDRGWLTNDGPLVAEFEARVADLSGVEHCVAVANATVGLQVAAHALGITGEVIMPSFTFVATAHAMRWIGVEPVFCEIDPETHTLDPDAVARAVNERTGAILGVHLWGRSHHHERLAAFGLPLIYDAAHAVGCDAAIGDAAVLSFHATKVVNAAEGGAILTHDAELAERLRRIRNFGFVDIDTVAMAGTNAKMSELSAAMGITSLESFDAFVAVNRRNHERYAAELAGLERVRLLDYPLGERHNYHYVVLEVPADERDGLIATLRAENVLARRYFHPGAHNAEPYRASAPSLPVTEGVSARVVVLPTGTAMSEDDVTQVCAIFREALG